MPKKATKEAKETTPEVTKTPVVFKCKICGAEKPIEEMKVYRQYFPFMVVCKECEKTQ